MAKKLLGETANAADVNRDHFTFSILLKRGRLMILTMRKRLGASLVLVALAALSLAASCEEATVVPLGETATVGGMTFRVPDYDVRFIELNVDGKHYEYPRPVLTVPLTIKNVGQQPFVYNPTHQAPQMNEAVTPLLYSDPGPQAPLPPASKSPINGVFLQKGQLAGQILENRTLKPGEELRDIFLFEVPDAEAGNLIFSVPPSMHRGEMPALIRIPYTPREPKGPRIYKSGEAVDFDGVTLTITGANVVYVKTQDTAQGEGYSSNPLLKISYTITNKAERPVEYEPGHRAVGDDPGAALFSKDDTFKRVQFIPTTTAVGQVNEEKILKSGESVQDFVLFEAPDVGQLTLEYPAALFEREGKARIALEIDTKEPPLPQELQKKEEEKKPGGEGQGTSQ